MLLLKQHPQSRVCYFSHASGFVIKPKVAQETTDSALEQEDELNVYSNLHTMHMLPEHTRASGALMQDYQLIVNLAAEEPLRTGADRCFGVLVVSLDSARDQEPLLLPTSAPSLCLGLNPILLLRKGALSTLVNSSTHRRVLDELYILDRNATAEALSGYNDWVCVSIVFRR